MIMGVVNNRANRLRRKLADWPVRVLLLLCCFGQAALAQTTSPKTVLVLYDGGREFTSIQLTDHGIESTLNRALSNRVTIFREYMDLTRIYPANYPQSLRDFYRSKYSGSRPDAIVAIRGRTLDFLLQHGDELFSGVPIVSAAMDRRQIRARQLPPNVTGNSLQVRYWRRSRLPSPCNPIPNEQSSSSARRRTTGLSRRWCRMSFASTASS